MLSQGASKVNISLVVCDSDAEMALELIHGLFFGADVREEGMAAIYIGQNHRPQLLYTAIVRT